MNIMAATRAKARSKQTILGTFLPNHEVPFHNWYSYIEGYSSELIENLLAELRDCNIQTIYDPFGGTGTTPLVAAQHGIKSYYSETNPFMASVINTKINVVRELSKNGNLSNLISFRNNIQKEEFPHDSTLIDWGGFEKYFNPEQLHEILFLKQQIQGVCDDNARQILMLALSSIMVQSSLMIRRGDLRFAKSGEKKPEDFDVKTNFITKLDQIIFDIDNYSSTISAGSQLASYDSRDIEMESIVDCVITSPPYLNGTNYIRNTKLELKLNDFVNKESDLSNLHSLGIIAGINNVSKRNGGQTVLPCVEPYYEAIKEVSYDRRIETMVAAYFYDMNDVISRLAIAMKENGILIIDIGDSQFAGVHVPTHDLISTICGNNGFVKYDEVIIRERRSKNGMVLSQRLLKFKLNKCHNMEQSTLETARQFVNNLPYKSEPYSSRNWGHPWHSLCSYHGKLKPAIAHHLVASFTKPGDVVLDPLCGVGTIPFEACLQGRIGIGNDLSELAYVVSKAKLEAPEKNEVMEAVLQLKQYIKNNVQSYVGNTDYDNFGYNGRIPTYFHEDTYREILCARDYYKGRIPELTPPESMVFASLLHVLHGNRPYALSRNSHPLTPYAPTGEYVYKNVIEHITDKINNTYNTELGQAYVRGKAIFGDYSNINLHESVDAIICSPPFADSMRFYMQNWLRLWMCGWEPNDFKVADQKFLDIKQNNHFEIYDDFFEMCSNALKPKGIVVLHLGKTKKVDMARALSEVSQPYFDTVYIGSEDVSELEKHGIKDKGSTIQHQYLFLRKI